MVFVSLVVGSLTSIVFFSYFDRISFFEASFSSTRPAQGGASGRARPPATAAMPFGVPMRIYVTIDVYSQKLTSWVCNDQPCECAGVGAMLGNRPARQNGLEKEVVARVIARGIPRVIPRVIPFGSDFIYTNFRRGRDPDFTYSKNRRGRDRAFSYPNFSFFK